MRPRCADACEGISIHALCERGRPGLKKLCFSLLKFLSTPSAKEGDEIVDTGVAVTTIFLSTPSAKEGDIVLIQCVQNRSHFYPRPLRKRATVEVHSKRYALFISIHALCERGRHRRFSALRKIHHFYPRPLRKRATY